MKKTFILDTNVLLSDPTSIENFEDNHLIIPLLVLEELDRHKTRPDDVGRNCREVIRRLDAYRTSGDLSSGVPTAAGGTISVLSLKDGDFSLPRELSIDASSLDNMIIAFVLSLRANKPDVILVSKDINIRVKCSSLGITAQDYLSLRVADVTEELYTGVKVVTLTNDKIDKFYQERGLEYTEVGCHTLYPNQILVLKSASEHSQGSAIARLVKGRIVPVKKHECVFGLKPRNKEQTFSFDLLLDPDVKLVTLTSTSGCGKTLLALAAGLEQLQGVGPQSVYKKLIVSRPIQPVGRDLGFLPGTLEEKMDPWISPIRDNFEFLLGGLGKKKPRKKTSSSQEYQSNFNDPYLELMQENGVIEIEAISYIRGRSIPNAYIIIDEAQNLTIHELKTIITRAGDNTKIVLTGDVEQIDNVHVDIFTNGLSHAVEKFKEHDIAGHVTLIKGERSALASLAAKIL